MLMHAYAILDTLERFLPNLFIISRQNIGQPPKNNIIDPKSHNCLVARPELWNVYFAMAKSG